MKDLESALKLEKDYKKLRLNRKLKNSFDFLGKLRKLGFKDIRDFIDEKKLDYLKNIEIKEIFNNNKGINQILNSRDNGEEMLYITIPQNNNIVYIGDLDFNINYCNDNNINYYYMGYKGDSILCNYNDLSLSLITYNKELFVFLYKN